MVKLIFIRLYTSVCVWLSQYNSLPSTLDQSEEYDQIQGQDAENTGVFAISLLSSFQGMDQETMMPRNKKEAVAWSLELSLDEFRMLLVTWGDT